MAEKIKPWEVIERRVVFQSRQITVNQHIYRTTWGAVVDDYPTWELADWTAVIALTPEFDIVLVRNYRPGAHRIFTEPPGGRVDAGEEPLAAAARELLEETGYEAASYHPLPVMLAAPARNDSRAFAYIAFDAKCVGAQALEHGEELEVLTMPFATYLGQMFRADAPVNASHLAMVQCAAVFILQTTDNALEDLRESVTRAFAYRPTPPAR